MNKSRLVFQKKSSSQHIPRIMKEFTYWQKYFFSEDKSAQVRKDKGGAGYKSMGGGGGKSNGSAAQPSRLTMSRLEQVFHQEDDH